MLLRLSPCSLGCMEAVVPRVGNRTFVQSVTCCRRPFSHCPSRVSLSPSAYPFAVSMVSTPASRAASSTRRPSESSEVTSFMKPLASPKVIAPRLSEETRNPHRPSCLCSIVGKPPPQGTHSPPRRVLPKAVDGGGATEIRAGLPGRRAAHHPAAERRRRALRGRAAPAGGQAAAGREGGHPA